MVKFKDVILQEIRNTLAVHGRELVMRGKASGAKQDTQVDMLEKMFHGTESHASLIDLFLNGQGPYKHAFDVYEMPSNREGNELRKNGKMLELKEILHQHIGESPSFVILCKRISPKLNTLPGYDFIVHEQGFTREAIATTKGVKVNGRTLNDRALNVVQNFKHALRFYKQYANTSQEEGVNPSGMSLEDMSMYVRRKMYAKSKGAKDGKGLSRSKDKVVSEEDMPPNYLFNGFLVFMLFGPMGLAKSRLSCLSENGDGVEPGSRAKSCKDEAQLKKAEREGGDDEAYNRGIPLQQKATAAHLAARESTEEKQNIRELLFIASTDHSNLLEELRSVNDMMKDSDLMDEDSLSQMKEWKRHIFESLDNVRKRKRRLQEKSDILMNASPKKQVVAFYEQVGKKFTERPKKQGTPVSTVVVDGDSDSVSEDGSTKAATMTTASTNNPPSGQDSVAEDSP